MVKKCLFLILLLLSLSACRNSYDYPSILRGIDSLAVYYPDSALKQLQQIEDGIFFRNEKYLANIYHHTAKVYLQLHDIPQALNYYEKTLKRINYIEPITEKREILRQAGNLFLSQSLYDKSQEAFRNAYIIDTEKNDTISMLQDLKDIALTYRFQDNEKDALVYYKKAQEIALKRGDSLTNNYFMAQIASILTNLGKTNEAMTSIEPLLSFLDSNNVASIYSTVADIYYKIVQFNAADYYYNELLNIGNIYEKREAHGKLASINAYNHQHEDALYHMAHYIYLNDSIEKMMIKENAARINSIYNYQLKENENNQLKLKQKGYQIMFMIVVAMIIISGLFAAYYIIRNRNKRLELELDIERYNKIQNELYRSYAEFIAESNRKIDNLNTQIAFLEENKEKERKRILKEKEKIEKAKNDVELRQNADWQIAESPLCQQLHEKAMLKERAMNTKEWQEADNLIQTYYPNFFPTLESLISLNTTERQICSLLKLQFNPSEIAALIAQTNASVSINRKRLYKKAFRENGSPTEWDRYIRSL